MKLSNSFIAVKKIKSSVPRSNFSEDDLNRAAELILKVEGSINPLILRITSPQSYQVVDGDFEYYAATRAKEIDSQKGEYIGAFIIEPDNEEVLAEQVKLLRKQKATTPSNELSSSDISESRFINMESRQTNSESRQTNLESRVENRFDEFQEKLTETIKTFNNRLNELENRLPKPIEPLAALNNWDIRQLTAKLSRVIQNKIIENIVSEREKNGNFTSFSDVVNRTKGLGDKTMLKIIDSLSNSAV